VSDQVKETSSTSNRSSDHPLHRRTNRRNPNRRDPRRLRSHHQLRSELTPRVNMRRPRHGESEARPEGRRSARKITGRGEMIGGGGEKDLDGCVGEGRRGIGRLGLGARALVGGRDLGWGTSLHIRGKERRECQLCAFRHESMMRRHDEPSDRSAFLQFLRTARQTQTPCCSAQTRAHRTQGHQDGSSISSFPKTTCRDGQSRRLTCRTCSRSIMRGRCWGSRCWKEE
jgi:hypothetical protein